MTRSLGRLVAAGLLATVSCIPFNGPGDVRRDLSQAAGVKLDRQFAMTVGRTGIMIARLVTDGDEIPLRGVRKVEIGVYEVESLGRGVEQRASLDVPRLPGWENVVRVHEGDEDVFVLIREQEGEIRGLLVVVAEHDEWVLVRVRGKLQHVVEKVMELAFDEAERPDLYEPAAAQYRQRGEDSEVETGPGIEAG